MYIDGLLINTTRGFDVFRSSKLLRHFDSYEEAVAFAKEGPGRWLRFWELKSEEEKRE